MQDLECGNLYQKIELIILHSEHSSELPRHHNCSPLLAASGQVCDGVIWDGSARCAGSPCDQAAEYNERHAES